MGDSAELQDRIRIRDLHCRCLIGIRDNERKRKQDLLINLTLYADLKKAGRSDRIEDTVNYSDVEKKVALLVESSEFFLLERLAESIAETCLAVPGVEKVRVCLEKDRTLHSARSAAVEILRP